ncbi:hypothetical protein ACA910_018939 [Epithemia clementina (nom. ined.)]
MTVLEHSHPQYLALEQQSRRSTRIMTTTTMSMAAVPLSESQPLDPRYLRFAPNDQIQQIWKQALWQQGQLDPNKDPLYDSSFPSWLVQGTNDDNNNNNNTNATTALFFSACLIVKDDNHWLMEWLAYHYHVLPLRHLVVVQDPSSQTSSRHILQRWRHKRRSPLEIEEWTDADFLPRWVLEKQQREQQQQQQQPPKEPRRATLNATSSSSSSSLSSGLWLHLNRQKQFYGACLRHLQRRGRTTWVTLTDTDEFIRINPIQYPLPWSIRAQAGHVVRFLESPEIAASLRHVARQQRRQQQLEHANHPVNGGGTMTTAGHKNRKGRTSKKVVHQNTPKEEEEEDIPSPCLMVPRLQLSSMETSTTYGNNSSNHILLEPPSPFAASDFLTYRWLRHNGDELPAGKNIVKLYPTDTSLPKGGVQSVHHVLDSCPRNTPGESTLVAPPPPPAGDNGGATTTTITTTNWLQIHHYLGTLEQFTFRDDPRDLVDDRPMQWHSRGRIPEPTIVDTGMTAWLHGFVKSEGVQVAQELLQHVGQVEPLALQNSHNKNHRDKSHLLQHVYNETMIQEHLERMKNGYDKVAPFSACLILMDDNHWLIEWLAYHYHVLPLRRLIYVQDPQARTSAQPIFDRWKSKMEFLVQWEDAQFLPTHIQKKYEAGKITNAALHRYRQKFFYSSCLVEFQKQQQQQQETAAMVASSSTSVSSPSPPWWVLLADTDEFVRPNSFLRKNSHVPTSLFKSGTVSRFLQSMLRASRVVYGNAQSSSTSAHHACLYIPRLQMTSKEEELPHTHNSSHAAPWEQQQQPQDFDRNRFLTMRWLYHNGKELVFGDHNLDGKNIIDVSRLPNNSSTIPKQIKNVHHVLPEYCPASLGGSSDSTSNKNRILDRDSWLLIHHYLGTFEQYMFRHDPRDVDIPGRFQRADYERWQTLGQPAHVRDTYITSWLEGFVASVGREEAQRLLQHVGDEILAGRNSPPKPPMPLSVPSPTKTSALLSASSSTLLEQFLNVLRFR